MKQFILLSVNIILFTQIGLAKEIKVKNINELNQANANALPGDNIILQNGVWNNVAIILTAKGTQKLPINFKAQTAGMVIISGNSTLEIGGDFIIIKGLKFVNGFAGKKTIINFKAKNTVANNCQLTQCEINDFNNPKRLDENYWIALHGKKNQIDHCNFTNKKNMGVLLAVILDKEESRENFHSISNNYFGVRLPLASNTGEIIRVGVSEHCQFNSCTQITNNYFDNCDGETEIISIKSGNNTIRNNVFKECQGAVVLRHGNYNTVENNLFWGNSKEGTGGVRIINKGQWVVNNMFYKCIGNGFRSPLSIMNGVPNSPANRYVEVSEAVIANNSFYNCSPISFCEGASPERSVAPYNTKFINNLFYNTFPKNIYDVHDSINKIFFEGNIVSFNAISNLIKGFYKNEISMQKGGDYPFPNADINKWYYKSDSLTMLAKTKLQKPLSLKQGFADLKNFKTLALPNLKSFGAIWASKTGKIINLTLKANCNNVEEILDSISNTEYTLVEINLTGSMYHFSKPVLLNKNIVFYNSKNNEIKINTNQNLPFIFQNEAGKNIAFKNIKFNFESANAKTFLLTDTSGSINHSSLTLEHCDFKNLNGSIINVSKTSVLDKVLIEKCTFQNNSGLLFAFNTETDKKGYYNVEQIVVSNNQIKNHNGPILNMLRSGTDESTLGPNLKFSKNNLENIQYNEGSLIHLEGIQITYLEFNSFSNCNENNILIIYKDLVRAKHIFKNNLLKNVGEVESNVYVEQ